MSDRDAVVFETLRWPSSQEKTLMSRIGCSPGIPLLLAVFAGRHVCWLSQQAVEKALKAALVLDRISFPFTHDLDALRNLLPDEWAVRHTHADLAELTEWAIETRYPGDWMEPTNADAARAESEARAVYGSVEVELRRRGVLQQ